MVKFTAREVDFINSYEVCRLATVAGNRPHVVPVAYIFEDDHFYIATDYSTKKYRNVMKNRNVSLVIDTYQPNKAVMIEGEAEVIERGSKFEKIYQKFYKKGAWVRATPWKEGEAPFIKVKPLKKVSWGI